MNIICTIVCLSCSLITVFVTKRFIYILKQLDEEQLRKVWEGCLYEYKKEDHN